MVVMCFKTQLIMKIPNLCIYLVLVAGILGDLWHMWLNAEGKK